MLTVLPCPAVLLTGASGFLAAHIGQQLLQRGYRVRGTVRSTAKGEYLQKLYESEGLKGFEFVIVEDVEQVRLPLLPVLTSEL